MSLNWNLTAVANHDDHCFFTAPEDDLMRGRKKGDRCLTPTTYTIVMISMSVGLGGITEANWQKWYARARAVEKLGGAFRHRMDDDNGQLVDVYLSPEDVHSHIGLTVNVSRETDAQWRKRMVGGWLTDFEQRAQRWLTDTDVSLAAVSS